MKTNTNHPDAVLAALQDNPHVLPQHRSAEAVAAYYQAGLNDRQILIRVVGAAQHRETLGQNSDPRSMADARTRAFNRYNEVVEQASLNPDARTEKATLTPQCITRAAARGDCATLAEAKLRLESALTQAGPAVWVDRSNVEKIVAPFTPEAVLAQSMRIDSRLGMHFRITPSQG